MMRTELASIALLGAVLAACYSDPDSPPETGLDTSVPEETDTEQLPVTYALTIVAEGEVAEAEAPRQALTISANGYSYALDESAEFVRYLTDAYVHPTGDYCVNPDQQGECAGGTDWTSGRIRSLNPTSHMCVDELYGRLFLVKDDLSKVEEVDVSFEGEQAYTFNRPNQTHTLELAEADPAVFDGPCAYLPNTDELLFSAPDSGWLASFDMEAEEGEETVTLYAQTGLEPSRIYLLDGGVELVMDDANSNSIAVVDAADFSVSRSLEMGSEVHDFALDSQRGVVYVARGGLGAARVDLNLPGDLVAEPIEVDGVVEQVVVDPTTGTALFASEHVGSWSVTLVEELEVDHALMLDEDLLMLSEPGSMGDFVLWMQRASGEIGYDVYDAIPDIPPDLPPLHVFLASAVEQPFSLEIECEADEGDSVSKILDYIRCNAAVLQDLEVPMSMGLVYNFAVVTEECGLTTMPQELQDSYGFEVGTMVHDKPGYNCTDKEVEGVEPDACVSSDPDYCNPERPNASCTWPDDPDYCDRGDWDCYKAFIDEHNVVADAIIPGGGAFISSADRHGMWDWDWVRAYQEMARADGGNDGYDVTLMAQAWASSSEVEYDDPRGKNPAPWRAADSVQAWYLEYYDDWTVDSAFSDLLYLPGLTVSTIKLGEWHQTGLFMNDFLDHYEGTITYSEQDFEVLHQYLRRALNHRTVTGPNVWYFHVHDIGQMNLAAADCEELDGADLLREFVPMVKETYESPGYIEWMTPSEIRAAYLPN